MLRRKITRRDFVLGAGMAAGAVMLGGCGGGSPAGEGEREVAEDVSGEVSLAGFASSPAEEESLRQLIAAFEEENGNITVDYRVITGDYIQKLVTELSSNTAADVFYLDAVYAPQLLATGAIRPLDDYVSGSDLARREDFYEPLIQAFTGDEDGQLYGIPKDYSTLGLFYNQQLLDEAGVEPPTTWEELRLAGQELTGDDRWGLSIQPELPRYLAFALQQEAPLINEDGQVMPSLDGNLAALEFFAGIYAGDPKIAAQPADTGADWSGDALGRGDIGMVFEGNWAINFFNESYPDLNYGISRLPSDGSEDTLLFTVAYAMNSNAGNPDAAWRLIEYLTSQQGQSQLGEQSVAAPSREDAVDAYLEANPQAQPLVDAAPNATAWQLNTPDPQPVIDDSNNAIQQAFSEGPEQFGAILEDWQQTVQQRVDEASE